MDASGSAITPARAMKSDSRTMGQRHPLMRAVVRRILLAVPLLVVVSGVSFVLLSFSGDPALHLLGINATPVRLAALRHQLGLDRPLPVQYWIWMSLSLHGN